LTNEIELESFYDSMYDSIDIIKLYKKQLDELKKEDGLFEYLYDVVDKLHLAMVENVDRASVLEAKEIQKKYVKVS